MLYECVVLFSPELSSEELEAARAKVEDTLTKKGGSIALWDHWGDRRLTYPIKKKNRAFFSVAYIDANNEAKLELVRTLKLNEAVLRHMIVKPPVAPDLAAIANKSQARAEYDRDRDRPYGDRDRYESRGPRGDDRDDRYSRDNRDNRDSRPSAAPAAAGAESAPSTGSNAAAESEEA